MTVTLEVTQDPVARFVSAQLARRPGDRPLYAFTAGQRFDRIEVVCTEQDLHHPMFQRWVQLSLMPCLAQHGQLTVEWSEQ